MLDLIFIGTLHCGFTPNKDLEQIFLDYKPSTLLIEITQEDINSNTIENYPPEMQFALQYSKKNNIPFFGFDSNIDVTLKGSTKEDEKKVIQKQKEIINKYDWKAFNKKKFNNLLNVKGRDKLIDQNNWDKREKEMEQNIKKQTPKNGTVLIITGTGHIPFFKEKFPEAKFPLSN